MPAEHLEIEPPAHLAGLPRDDRGFLVPAETPWTGNEPHLSLYNLPRTLALALGRACAVCGFELRPGNAVWRIFTQRDAATARGQGQLVDDLSAPGHESCMLYSTLVCPFWRSAGARLGKDSLREPSAPRGTRPAVLGYTDAYLLVEPGRDLLNTTPPAFRFLYVEPSADVRFREPLADLATTYKESLDRDSFLGDLDPESRFYWRGDTDDNRRLFDYLAKALPSLLERKAGPVQGAVLYERIRMESVPQ